MKKTYLFCTKIWFYLCEIPPIVLLIISLLYNSDSTGLLKLFPLIIISSASIVFIFLYFFRMIIISFEEIKCIGAFSSKDSATINKEKSLIFTLSPGRKMIVRLYGNSGAPGFDWAKNEDYEPTEIDLFREKAIGNMRSIERILSYFKVPDEDIKTLVRDDVYEKEYENFIVKKECVDNKTTVSIKFTNTI